MARNTGRRSSSSPRRESSGITREEYVRRQRQKSRDAQMEELLRRAETPNRNTKSSKNKRKDASRSSKKNMSETLKRNRITGRPRRKETISEDDDIDLAEEERKENIKKALRKKIIKIAAKILLVVLIVLFIMLIVSLVKWNTMAHDMIQNKSSVIVDINGDKIGEIGTKRNRENISIDDMPKDLQHAYISIEDQRFYKHGGVDIRRTGAATINYITSF